MSGRQKIMDAMSHLETIKMESPSHAAYLSAAYLNGPDAPEISTRTFNRATEIRDLAVSGKGNAGKTRADLFNGFTEYFTSGNGAGGAGLALGAADAAVVENLAALAGPLAVGDRGARELEHHVRPFTD